MPLADDFSRQELGLLYEATAAIHTTRDLDEMLRLVLGLIRKALDIEGASLALHDPVQQEFYFMRTAEGSQDGGPTAISRMRFPDRSGVAAWVMKNRRTAVVPDADRDERIYRGLEAAERLQTRSLICVPLQTHRGFLGVFYALNKRNGAFTRREGRLLETLGASLAVAIENARLYGELTQHVAVLERDRRRLLSAVRDRYRFPGIVGGSPPMLQVFALLEKVLPTRATVLIQGETGTGKELIARVLHVNGPLKDRPFVAENCGALSETLLESELFGHVRGAYTGAVSDKKGLFELADGGTLFLDEIGEMSPTMQVKLLRVIQEGQVRPVGAARSLSVTVRLIASTNRDLEAEVRAGRFRQDLFYRINVFPIHLPPLRSRKSDIPLLTRHFLKKFSRQQGRPPARLTPAALELLDAYDWPGNVRELANELERALTLAGTDTEITSACLSARFLNGAPHLPLDGDPPPTLRETVERIERRMVRAALVKTGGNRSRAARLLGLTRQGLLNKLNRYGLGRPQDAG